MCSREGGKLNKNIGSAFDNGEFIINTSEKLWINFNGIKGQTGSCGIKLGFKKVANHLLDNGMWLFKYGQTKFKHGYEIPLWSNSEKTDLSKICLSFWNNLCFSLRIKTSFLSIYKNILINSRQVISLVNVTNIWCTNFNKFRNTDKRKTFKRLYFFRHFVLKALSLGVQVCFSFNTDYSAHSINQRNWTIVLPFCKTIQSPCLQATQ